MGTEEHGSPTHVRKGLAVLHTHVIRRDLPFCGEPLLFPSSSSSVWDSRISFRLLLAAGQLHEEPPLHRPAHNSRSRALRLSQSEPAELPLPNGRPGEAGAGTGRGEKRQRQH